MEKPRKHYRHQVIKLIRQQGERPTSCASWWGTKIAINHMTEIRGTMENSLQIR